MTAPSGAFTKKENSTSNFNKTGNEEVRLQGFIFGGLNGIASNNNLKNLVKFPQKWDVIFFQLRFYNLFIYLILFLKFFNLLFFISNKLIIYKN